MVCKRVILSGKVQGVSFRYHTHEQAAKRGLTGWVRNLADGRVELIVAGPGHFVEEVVVWAHKGPPAAQVEEVQVSEVKDNIPNEPFYIRRDGGR